MRVTVYDLLGRRVALLLDRHLQAGWHEVQWNAAEFPSGLYVYRIESEARSLARTMLLIR